MTKTPSQAPGSPEDDKKGPEKGVTRRAALKGILKGGAVIALANLFGGAVEIFTGKKADDKAEPQPAEPSAHAPAESMEELSEAEFEKLNRDTAIPVFTAFTAFVGNAAMGGSLDTTSVVTMNILEGERLTRLYAQGGKKGRELSHHELAGNAQSAAIAMGLVAISDFTTSGMAVEADAVLKDLEAKEDGDDTPKPLDSMPGVDAPLEAWEAYSKILDEAVVDSVTQTVAVSGTVAPFATTYTSSAVMDKLKMRTAPKLYAQGVARAVIESKKSGQAVDLKEAQKSAAKRASDLMKDLTDLATTLAANAQGDAFWGNPPQIFGIADQFGKWERLGKANLYGAGQGALFTLGLTQWWLKEAGIEKTDITSRMAGHVLEFSKQTAQQALGGLGVEKNPSREVDYRWNFSKEYWRNKAKALKAIGHKVTSAPSWVKNALSRKGSMTPEMLSDMLLGGKMPEEGVEADVISDDILDLITRAPSAEEVAQAQAMAADLTAAKEAQGVATPAAATDETAQMDVILERMGVPAAEATAMNADAKRAKITEGFRELAANNPTQYKTLAKKITAKAKEKEGGVDHHGSDLVNHTGKEVFNALYSQLPAVEPSAVLAEQMLTSTFDLRGGVEAKSRSPKGKVIAACSSALVSVGLLSAFADNVAAYKYGDNLLCRMVERVYGEACKAKTGKSLFEAFPSLRDCIFATAQNVAGKAGSMTKLGNGPNFSQKEVKMMDRSEVEAYTAKLPKDIQETVVQSDLDGDIVQITYSIPFRPLDNKFAWAATTFTLGTASAWIAKEISDVENELSGPIAMAA